jgi:hypothetical protein
MDWTRIIVYAVVSSTTAAATSLLTDLSSGDPPTALTWIRAACQAIIAGGGAVIGLMAKSADPSKQPSP